VQCVGASKPSAPVASPPLGLASVPQRIAAVLAGKGKAAAVPEAGGGGQHSPLAPAAELLARLQKELRLSKGQARRVWETLLFAVAVPAGERAMAAVEGMVRSRLEAQVAAAKQDSRGKSLRDTEGEGFVMCRGAAGPGGAIKPGAMVPVEGVSGEQQHAAIEEAVAGRAQQLREVVGLVGGEDEDGGEEEEEEEEAEEEEA